MTRPAPRRHPSMMRTSTFGASAEARITGGRVMHGGKTQPIVTSPPRAAWRRAGWNWRSRSSPARASRRGGPSRWGPLRVVRSKRRTPSCPRGGMRRDSAGCDRCSAPAAAKFCSADGDEARRSAIDGFSMGAHSCTKCIKPRNCNLQQGCLCRPSPQPETSARATPPAAGRPRPPCRHRPGASLSEQADPPSACRRGGNDMIARVVTERWAGRWAELPGRQPGRRRRIACGTAAPADGYPDAGLHVPTARRRRRGGRMTRSRFTPSA